MSIKKFFNLKTLISFIVTLLLVSFSFVVIAGPNLEKDIKKDISKYINYLNQGKISEYYSLYNTRKLSDIDKSLFYDKIRNTVKIVNAEKDTFLKYRMKVKVDKIDILEKMNDNLYLCNLKVTYQIRENTNTTKTIKKTEEYIVKVLDTKNDGYKILLPFNSLDKDFSETETFLSIEQIYKNKKAKEIEKKRKEKEKEEGISEEDKDKEKLEESESFEDENGLNVESSDEKQNSNNNESDKEDSKDTEKESSSNTDTENSNKEESDDEDKINENINKEDLNDESKESNKNAEDSNIKKEI